MNVQEAYNSWALQYDTNINKTRDLEAIAIRTELADLLFTNCLEIGCGTGKNTQWLLTKTNKLLGIDISEEMLAKAKEKIKALHVSFLQADILQPWQFINEKYNLVTFSLVLEHIENLDALFKKLSQTVITDGYVYIGELHPFKQYAGTKARFETEEGLQVVTCFTHHLSDFTEAALHNGFTIIAINEYFDDNDRNTIPRILTMLFKKISM